MSKMKILFLTHSRKLEGYYYRCFPLGKFLSLMGHHVTLVCVNDKSGTKRVSVEEVNRRMRIILLPTISSFTFPSEAKHENLGRALRRYVIGPLWTTQKSLFGLFYEYDIIHGFSIPNPQNGIPLIPSKAFRRKVVFADVGDPWEREKDPFGAFIRSSFSTLGRFIPRIANGVTVVSDYLYSYCKKLGTTNLYKLPNGANIEDIKPIDKMHARENLGIKSGPLLLSLGLLTVKQLEILLEAFSLVLEELSDARLLLVGKGMGMVDKLVKLPKNVKGIGWQPSEKIPYYLCAADALVLPMEPSIADRGRMSATIFDYLAAGRPVVSNAVGEVRRLLKTERCGLLSPVRDVKDYAQNMITILRNGDMQLKLGIHGRKVAEKHSWAGISSRLAEIYNNTLCNS